MKTQIKTGQKIKIIAAEEGASGANGCIGTILSIGPYFQGKINGREPGYSDALYVMVYDTHFHPGEEAIWNIGCNAVFDLILQEWDDEENI